MNKAIIVDVSRWNTNLDWRKLYEGGVRYAYVKISQGKYIVDDRAVQHIAEARAAGIIVAGYHWADANYPDADQLELIIKLMKQYELELIFIDVEQYWKDWGEWQRGEVKQFIDPVRIDRNARNLYYGAINAGFKAVVYTRATFIDSYSPQMWDWIYSANVVWAYYVYSGVRENISWDELREAIIPTLANPKRYTGGKWIPVRKWTMWQFSGDKFILPGTGGTPIDLNIAYDDNYIRELFGAAPITEPEEPAPEEPPQESDIQFTVIRAVNVRKDTNTTAPIVRTRRVGETVQALDVDIERVNRVWVKDADGWSALTHDGIQFMKDA